MGVVAYLKQYDIRFEIYPREPHYRAHCHVKHKGKKAVLDLNEIFIFRGRLDPKAEGRALDFARERQNDLLNAWHTMRSGTHPEMLN